jgi:hypothetical protein
MLDFRTQDQLTPQMIGLDGIAVINIVVSRKRHPSDEADYQSNPAEAEISGNKKIQTRITHNDGGSWKPLSPPAKDSLGQQYDCSSTVCPPRNHLTHLL